MTLTSIFGKNKILSGSKWPKHNMRFCTEPKMVVLWHCCEKNPFAIFILKGLSHFFLYSSFGLQANYNIWCEVIFSYLEIWPFDVLWLVILILKWHGCVFTGREIKPKQLMWLSKTSSLRPDFLVLLACLGLLQMTDDRN